MRNLYHLLFYKIFWLTSLIRTKANASFITGLLIGLLFIFFIGNFFGLINLPLKIPKIYYLLVALLSIFINVLYFNLGKRYEIIISEMKSKKLHFFYHLIVYIFLLWASLGFVFLSGLSKISKIE